MFIHKLTEKFSRKLRGEQDGQAMVEIALTLPVLLLVVTGITTFGLALNNFLQLTEATALGARQFSQMRGQGGDPCAVSVSTIATAAPLLKGTSLGYSFTVASTTYAGAAPTCTAAALSQGKPVVVNITYPCTLKVFGSNLVPSCQLTAQTTELIQ